MSLFLSSLKRRVHDFGWSAEKGIILIPKTIAANHAHHGLSRNLLTQYGVIYHEEIRKYDATYQNLHGREAQDNLQLYNCVLKSLKDKAKGVIKLWEK